MHKNTQNVLLLPKFIYINSPMKKINMSILFNKVLYTGRPIFPYYIVSLLQRVKRFKETGRRKRVLVVNELFNITLNDFDTKKSARCSRILVNRTHCTRV